MRKKRTEKTIEREKHAGPCARDTLFALMDFVAAKTLVPIQPDLQVRWLEFVKQATELGWRPSSEECDRG